MSDSASRLVFVRIDPRQPESLQFQIYEHIRRAILGGSLAPGTRLPSSRALAADLGLSRITTVLAFEHLAAEGYVTSRTGTGTFVSRELPETLARTPVRSDPRGLQHPPLSRRGLTLSQVPPIVTKLGGAPRAFRIGTPALDRFPFQIWNRLVSRHMRRLTARQLDYGDPAGLHALRSAIADYVSRARGTSCTADQVIVVAGAQQALGLITRLLLDPGDVAWMEEPGYPGARSALLAAGARIQPVRVDAQGLDVEYGEQRSNRARLVITTPSHQFPLGVPMSLPRRLALLGWARAADAWIVEDDYDSEFRYGERPIPCLHGLDTDGRVIYVGSFSKTLFPALRLGYLIVPPDLHATLQQARVSSDLQPQGVLQAVVADLMNDGHFERHLRRMNTEYRARLGALAAGVARYCGGALELRPVVTGLHAVADLKQADATRVFDEALARGVETMPLAAYYSDRRSSRANGLMLGFGSVSPRLVTEGVKRLAEAIDAASSKPSRALRKSVASGTQAPRR
jgi:GntR family transcriptional regulator/MocR family aminotransferase